MGSVRDGIADENVQRLAASAKETQPKDPDDERTVAELHVEFRKLQHALSKSADAETQSSAETQSNAETQLTAESQRDAEHALAIARLCALFVEIGEHPDLPRSQTLQSLSVRLRARLMGLERRTTDELKRRAIPEPQSMVEARADRQRERAGRSSGSRPMSPGKQEIGKQETGGELAGREFNGSQSSASQSAGSATPDQRQGADRANSLGGNAAPGPDFGWLLVDLIRKTVQPDYWSVAGGPGKAIYFGHSRALVIHGSWRVQEDVADMLTALRGG